jgi:predicted enzyme related to lactoylglutathione lyase
MYYVGVESVADSLDKVEQLGGKVIMPKSPVPGMGWFAHRRDTEGNMFALRQDDSSAA